MAGCAKLRWDLSLLSAIFFATVFGLMTLVIFVIDVARKGVSRMFHVRSRTTRPEVLNSSTYGSHGFARLQNVRIKLHYVASGSTDKPLMLFLHGFPEFWYSWRHQLKEFSKDYRAVAVDMRGYGDSDKPSGIYNYTIDTLVEDVNQLITALGYEKCVLVGHDWGGAVAWSYAALHPDRVDKLVVGNIGHPLAFQIQLKSSFSQLRKSWYMFFFQVPVLPLLFLRAEDLGMFDKLFKTKRDGNKGDNLPIEDIEAFKYTFADYGDLCGPVNFYRAAMRYQSPKVEEAFKRKISVPTLMIWGTNDLYLERQMAEGSRRFVEDYDVHYIEGGSHWIQQDEPQQFNTAVRKFLSRKS